MNIVMYIIPKIGEEGEHDIPKGNESDQVLMLVNDRHCSAMAAEHFNDDRSN